MTRDSSQSDSRLTRRQTAVLSLIAVVFILVAGAAVVTAQQETEYPPRTIDFDSEPADEGVSEDLELVSGNPNELRVTDEVAYSDPNSFYATENSPDSAVVLRIQSHPMSETQTDTVSARIAKTDDDFETGDDIINIRLLNDSQELGFGGVGNGGDIFVLDGDTVVNTGDSVELGTFVRFRLTDIDPETDTYTVEWTADGQSGVESNLDMRNGIGTGYDEVQIAIDESGRFDDFTVPAAESVGVDPSDDLRLDVPKYLPHNDSSHYAVEANQSGEWVDVTDSATVTPGNTDVLTFYPDNQTVVAGGNKSINERVNVTAEYAGMNATGNIVVATPTVDNLDLLPAWWSVNALLSDWTVIWILMATLIATAATRMATTFAGIGAFVMAMVMGWIMGDVPNGIMVATTFMGIFIGLNLAANIDYSVR